MIRLVLLALLCVMTPLGAQEVKAQFKGWVYFEEHHPDPHYQIFDNEKALDEFRGRIPRLRPQMKKPAPPNEDPLLEKNKIDFTKYRLLVVTWGQTLSAYPVLEDIEETPDEVVLIFDLPEPPPEAMPHGWGTYRAVLLPIYHKPFKVKF
jgi:hypothetical protein